MAQAQLFLEQQTDKSGILQDDFLIRKVVGIVDNPYRLDSERIIGLGSHVTKDETRELIRSGYLVTLSLPATFKG